MATKAQMRGWKQAVKAAEKRRPPMCEECGVYRSDPPSKIYVGCQAYKEHQQ